MTDTNKNIALSRLLRFWSRYKSSCFKASRKHPIKMSHQSFCTRHIHHRKTWPCQIKLSPQREYVYRRELRISASEVSPMLFTAVTGGHRSGWRSTFFPQSTRPEQNRIESITWDCNKQDWKGKFQFWIHVHYTWVICDLLAYISHWFWRSFTACIGPNEEKWDIVHSLHTDFFFFISYGLDFVVYSSSELLLKL
jgi:hypothetical protein